MTESGFRWITSFISKQGDWFNKKLNDWVEYVHGSNDHSADFCSPFFYPLAATIGVAKFFCASVTTLCSWPVAIVKDFQHMPHDLGAAFASLFCVTPIYVIIMTIVYLLGSIVSLILLLAIIFLAIFVALYFGARYVFEKILTAVGTCVGFLFKTANR